MRFSQRIGVKPIRLELQVESMDEELRNSLWSTLSLSFWQVSTTNYFDGSISFHEPLDKYCKALWLDFFKWPIDNLRDDVDWACNQARDWYFKADWHEVYDLIEFSAPYASYPDSPERFIEKCNAVLERELSGYRFAGMQITPITSAEELSEVEAASKCKVAGVRLHIEQAIRLLSDRKKPDYRNSIKESISAVESACRSTAGDDKAELSKALQVIEKRHPMHPAFREAVKKLYGWTSDDDGIRHAIMDEPIVDFADAKFMLVACSAFCNFLQLRTKSK